jgi:hypothetical protein
MQKQKLETIVKGNKIENIKLENDLESKRRLIKIKINEKKEEINFVIKDLNDLEKEISDLNIDMELHDKYGKDLSYLNLFSDNEISPKRKNGSGIKTIGKSFLMMNYIRVNIYIKINIFDFDFDNKKNYKLFY